MKNCLCLALSPCTRRMILSTMICTLLPLAFATTKVDAQVAQPGELGYYWMDSQTANLYYVNVTTGAQVGVSVNFSFNAIAYNRYNGKLYGTVGSVARYVDLTQAVPDNENAFEYYVYDSIAGDFYNATTMVMENSGNQGGTDLHAYQFTVNGTEILSRNSLQSSISGGGDADFVYTNEGTAIYSGVGISGIAEYPVLAGGVIDVANPITQLTGTQYQYGGLGYNWTNGKLYASNNNALFEIDRNTLQTIGSPIANFSSGVNGVDGTFGPYPGAAIIPEPSSTALIGLAGCCLVYRRRRKTARSQQTAV